MYIITRLTNPKKVHKVFRSYLTLELVTTATSQLHPLNSPPKPDLRSYVTSKTPLPPFSFRTTGNHRQSLQANKKQQCWNCRYKKTHGNPKYPPPARNRVSVLQQMKVSDMGIWCSLCEIRLCKRNGCFLDFHTVS